MHDILRTLETKSGTLLWPRTKLNTETIQRRLRENHGYDDYGIDNKQSRIYQTNYFIHDLMLWDGSVVMDIGCGDGRILYSVAREYPIDAIGIDLNYEQFPDHEKFKEYVSFYAIDMLQLFEVDVYPEVVFMFNTFSHWDRATNGTDYLEMAKKCEAWIFDHAKFLITDLNPVQIAKYESGRHLYLDSHKKDFYIYPNTAVSVIEIVDRS